jgi:putative nucleotidyltransferase with HDIG domain
MRKALQHSSLSVFEQGLEKAAFLAYFLGAVVPLLALAFVVHRYALPQLREGPWPYALGALTVSFSFLSLGAFFLLRRVTWSTIQRMDKDKQRLETLLEASGSLGKAVHQDEVHEAAAACAVKLTDAEAAFVLQETQADPSPAWVCQEGSSASALQERFQPTLESMLELALSGERPVLHGHGEKAANGRDPDLLAAAVPILSDRHRGALLVANGARRGGFAAAPIGALSTLGALASVALSNAELREAQQNFFVHVTDMLLSALDSHMDLQTGHARRVAHFANRMGRELGLEDERLQRLHFAALLHDIGMLKISPELRHNQQACRQHPMLGFRMLHPIQLWEDIAPFVLLHHEWFNGKGYPKGLAGEQIPLEARIIGVAEAFDSMTSRASYKTPVPSGEALRRITEGAGTQFDPALASMMIDLVRRGVIEVG